MHLRLSEDLPLRTTAALGNFAETLTLPHRYGDLTAARFPLIRLDDRRFFAADHPMEITSVYVDDQETATWERTLETDDAGNAYTVVTVGAAVPAESSLSAAGRGKLDPATGALIENPADIMVDVLRLAGRPELFPRLRAEAAAEGITLAGSIGGGDPVTIRATLDQIAASAAAIWTPIDGRLYPARAVTGLVYALDNDRATDLDVSADLEDTCDVLRVYYDVSDATERAQRYVELTASPQRFGGTYAEITLAMMRKPSNAETTGRRVLRRMAGRRYSVRFNSDQTDLRPGNWARLDDNLEWPTPDVDPVGMVLAVDVTPDDKTVSAVMECVLSEPVITVTAHSTALPTTQDAAIEVVVGNGLATFTITDASGLAVRGARVQLDGGEAKTTNDRGAVSFRIVADGKKHTLAVEAPGKVPFTMEVVL